MQLVKNAACKAISPDALHYVRRRLILKLNPTVTATGGALIQSPEVCADADPIATATESPTQCCLGASLLSGATFRHRSYTEAEKQLLHLGLGLLVCSGLLSLFLFAEVLESGRTGFVDAIFSAVSTEPVSECTVSPHKMSPRTLFTGEKCPPGHYSLVNNVPLGHYSLWNYVPPW